MTLWCKAHASNYNKHHCNSWDATVELEYETGPLFPYGAPDSLRTLLYSLTLEVWINGRLFAFSVLHGLWWDPFPFLSHCGLKSPQVHIRQNLYLSAFIHFYTSQKKRQLPMKNTLLPFSLLEMTEVLVGHVLLPPLIHLLCCEALHTIQNGWKTTLTRWILARS